MRLVNFFLLLLIWGEPALAADFFPKPALLKIGAPQKNREEAYQYGYNGQIKLNEIAGVGNHYSALYWEYDPRTARRWNVDPVDQISASNYSVLSGNPISRTDPLGNTDDIIEVDTKGKSYSVTKTNDPYDIVIERRENGKSGLAAAGLPNNTNDGITPIHFQKGSWQEYLNYKGYTEKAPLRGAQSEEFAVEMAAADGAGKLVGKGVGLLWGKVFGRAATETVVTTTTAGKTALVTANRAAGNAYRDEVAAGLAAEGRQVATEVYKWTPFGARFIDIEVSQGGRILGGIETKVGKSPYTSLQKLKDLWLEKVQGYPVNLVRQPKP